MKNKNIKTLGSKPTTCIALILLLAMPALLVASIQPAKAATNYNTYSYIATTPNPTSLGVTVFATAWLDRYPPRGTLGSAPYALWSFTVTITDPSGNVQTKQLTSDPIGGATFSFVPDKVGTWILQAKFNGAGPVLGANNDTYKASTSNRFELIVQQDPIQPWPAAQLPTGYWERPIDAQDREWYSISGNWLGMPWVTSPGSSSSYSSMGKFNPFTRAPNTPHILWTKSTGGFGGLVGGALGTTGYYAGDSYDLRSYPLIIMNGVVYRNNMPYARSITNVGFSAIDLRTGETLWTTTNGSITFGQLLDYESLNQHGVIPFLWSTSLDVYDANTGRWLWNFANVTTGTLIQDEKGNILSYVLNQNQHTLSMWNSTQATLVGKPGGPLASEGTEYWRPTFLATNNWKAGVMWNVTIPAVEGNPSIKSINSEDKVILAVASIAPNSTYPDGVTVHAAYSLTDGHQMWVKFRTGEDSLNGQQAGFGYTVGPGVYLVQKQETEVIFCYDISTGNKRWQSDPNTNPWGAYYTTIGDDSLLVAYDKVFSTAYDGTLRCFDLRTGENLWNTFVGNSGLETPYGTWPLWGSLLAADGKVYAGTNEHSINQPMYRGERLYCFDVNTGDIIWKIYGIHMDPAIADGYLVTYNSYDNRQYVFGKGKTATSIQTPLMGIPAASEFAITGTVYDLSPGVPANTPAVSRESMQLFMEYVYMQKPQPTNTTGVQVQLVAINSNGEATDIGSVTTDSMGFFNTHWKSPDVAGDYKIVANFQGDDSYWSSSAIAAITVVAPTSTPASATVIAGEVVSQLPVQPTAPSASDVAAQVVSQLPGEDNTLLFATVAAVVVAIVIGLVNLAMQFRKKQA